MTSRARVALLAGALALLPGAPVAAQAPAPRAVTIAYVDRDGDPAYRGSTGYAGLFRRVASSPFPAAELAAADSAAAARVAGLRINLMHRTLAEGEIAAATVAALGRDEGAVAAVLDLPPQEMRAAALALAAEPIVLLNARDRDDELRRTTCRTRLFHTMPSRSMLYDGLAQGLVALGWSRVLLLRGPLDEDQAVAAAFAASARKFGLRIAETRPMLPGNDPRKRDQINTRLLTANVDYDVVFVSDSVGEMGRSVAFGQTRPRPVVGTHGLQPSAWHAFWERHGAPQLNRRFHRATGRPMADADWATWVAVRAVIAALIAHRDLVPGDLGMALLDQDSRLELYKALPGSFRPWSRQLRQTILLGTHDVVQTFAPVDGVLHEKNQLDTLGPDEPEFVCSQ